jgi:hypothetical protein
MDRNRRSQQAWNDLAAVLRDRRVFTTVPAVALLLKEPVVTEPFLHAVWEKVGRRDTRDIADGIARSRYDIVVTSKQRHAWRGVEFITPALGDAIADAYRPVCSLLEVTIHLPRAKDETLANQSAERALRSAGCS